MPKQGQRNNIEYKKSCLLQFYRGIVLVACMSATSLILANPVVNNVDAGSVTIQQSGNSTVVNQSSGKAIINWQSFNVGQNETVHFEQPSGGVALNRINPQQGASEIYGRLTATGQVILINSAGIYFGPSAYVNVGGLVASTADISNQNFLNGLYHFNSLVPETGGIINEGQLIAAQHGLIALIGSNVTNKGYIEAKLGSIVLASGKAFTMSFAGNELIKFSVDEKTLKENAGITNTGTLSANGGKILISAKAAKNVLDTIINMQGFAEAKSVSTHEGEIILSGDQDGGIVKIAANLDASGKNPGEKGGNITITGYNILVDAPSILDASGDLGGGKIYIGGNYQGKGPLPNANSTVFAPNARIYADAITSGNGGEIILWSDAATKAYGEIYARGGQLSGDGGFVETSAHYLSVDGIRVNLTATNGKTGTWLLDPSNIFVGGPFYLRGNFDGGDPNIFTTTGTPSAVPDADLVANLELTDVIITTESGEAAAGNITVSHPLTWTSSNSLWLDADGTITLSAPITATNGTLRLTAADTAASIVFSTNDPHVGSIDVNQLTLLQGHMQLNAADLISNTTAINLTGSTSLDLNGNNETIGSLSGSGTIGLGAGTLTITENSSNTYSGVISGSGGITKSGTGTLTLSGANTYTGATVINAGTVIVSNASGLGNTTSSLSVASGGTLSINNVDLSVGSLSGAGSISLGSQTFTITQSVDGTFSGVLSGAGALTKAGAAVLTLSGTNTYSGITNINAGTLAIANARGLGSSASGTNVLSNAFLDINGVNIGSEELSLSNATLRSSGVATVNGAISFTNSSSNTINAALTSLTLNGNLTGTATLTLQGAGSITINGSVASTITIIDSTTNGAVIAGSDTTDATTVAQDTTTNQQNNPANTDTTQSNTILTNTTYTNQNINELVDTVTQTYQNNLENTKIGPSSSCAGI